MSEPTAEDYARWDKWDDLRAREALASTEAEHAALMLEKELLRAEGTKEMLQKDMSVEPQWFWLSFRDPDTNTNLGVAIFEGGGIMEATLNARIAGCNPGGEVLAYPLDPDNLPPVELRCRLLTEKELEDAGLLSRES